MSICRRREESPRGYSLRPRCLSISGSSAGAPAHTHLSQIPTSDSLLKSVARLSERLPSVSSTLMKNRHESRLYFACRTHISPLVNGRRAAGLRMVETLAGALGLAVAELLKSV